MPLPEPLSTPALVDALIVDPFYLAISVDFENDLPVRKAVLAAYFGYSLGEAGRTGRCETLEDRELGAAAWLLPRSAQADTQESAAKDAFLSRTLGPRGYANYNRIVDFMGPHASAAVPAQAWYLSILGISPAAQGRGLGARLLAPTLAEADAAGVACYLETFTPRSVAFYERMGFQRKAAPLEPVTNSVYEIMCRPAKG
ncbi:N-acetyltransferase [Variovorax sp. EL159]|uniref:GNAT family N-acetyltransferase n=1 Tax=Variovorax sp. EL159 TaxID=1566270 RepID=UPI000886A50A|nr:GNAT family N-acetyltransferase [Variovorax sp. EL159]SCX61573.1 Acetyltransferase (GNAT) family protein [Variovorax sp. EL159]